MEIQRRPFFVYPPGARGDFISHVLYHPDPLATQASKAKIEAEIPAVKTHCLTKDENWAPTEFSWPQDAPKFVTHWIRVSPDRIPHVAWLNIVKNVPVWRDDAVRYRQLCDLTGRLQSEFAQYSHLYNWVIDFDRLWHLDSVLDITDRVTGRQFTPEQKDRVLTNIRLNLNLLSANPWKDRQDPDWLRAQSELC